MTAPTRWDRRFLELAELVAGWSKDPSTRCGAVVVRPDNTVCSVGYNGFPRGTSDAPALYEDREAKYSRVVHAEVNAVLHARERLDGYSLYTWPPSFSPTCDRCATCVIQSGVSRVACWRDETSGFSERWRGMFESALALYAEAGVEVVLFDGR